MRTASKPADSRKADEKQVADASGGTAPAMPASVANANAQMTSADASPDSAKGNVGSDFRKGQYRSAGRR